MLFSQNLQAHVEIWKSKVNPLEDGLHLSQQGSITLQKIFMSHLVNKIKTC